MRRFRRSLGIRSPASVLAVLWLLILAYATFFSVDSIRQHDAFLTSNADLGILDQTIWNTLHGRLFTRTHEGQQVTRFSDHVQPILAPISLVFLVWDDVRLLLVLQSLVIALGALPVFWLARDELKASGLAQRTSDVGGLVFAGVYLLYPALEAANRTEFHVAPFMVAPMLLALYYARRGSYRQMWLWALVVMAVKEEMALLTLVLGLVLLVSRPPRLHGLALMAISAAWFGIATFVILPRYAAVTHGTEQAYYLQRYGALGDSPLALARTVVTRPAQVWGIVTESARLSYLWGLLASAGLVLPLLAPELLLVGLPILLANMLSDYEAMYSGVYQYSAPIVPFVVAAAAVGLGRVIRLTRRVRHHDALAFGLCALLLSGSLAYHRGRGETPLARGYAWPQVTAHNRLLEQRFAPQIPAGSVLSTTNHLYPHLSHRERILEFPLVLDAEWVLLDAGSDPAMHPADFRKAYDTLIDSGDWCIVDAADGYILLVRREVAGPAGETHCQTELPDAFYDFARVKDARPTYRVEADFGHIRLLGYDIVEVPYHRRVGVRLYWTRTGAVQRGLAGVQPFVSWLGESGQVLGTSVDRPLVETYWYPLERWREGEVVKTEMMVWDMGQAFRLALALQDSQGNRLPVELVNPDSPAAYVMDGGSWLRLLAFRWEGAARRGKVAAVDEGALSLKSSGALFGGMIALSGFGTTPDRPAAGGELRVRLSWSRTAAAPHRDYTVFVHLLDASGQRVAQGDGMPGYLGALPTTQWKEGVPVLDEHVLVLPANLAPGTYHLSIGWYDAQTGERLPLSSGEDSLGLTTLEVR